MDITVKTSAFSADKDHEIMTGGTLTIDKVATGENLNLYTYTFPVLELVSEDLHKAVHSIEHLWAYSEESGSIRESLSQIDPNFTNKKLILDISPYLFENNILGFKITAVTKLSIDLLKQALKLSTQRSLEYIKNHNAIPFSTPKECGQYSLHNAVLAGKILGEFATKLEHIEIIETIIPTHTNQVVVGDLRMVKPRLFNNFEQKTLDPEASYAISRLLEKELEAKGYTALLGTFGCMTGMYFLIANNSQQGSEEFMEHMHTQIIDCMETQVQKIEKHKDNEPLSSNLKLCLSFVRR